MVVQLRIVRFLLNEVNDGRGLKVFKEIWISLFWEDLDFGLECLSRQVLFGLFGKLGWQKDDEMK